MAAVNIKRGSAKRRIRAHKARTLPGWAWAAQRCLAPDHSPLLPGPGLRQDPIQQALRDFRLGRKKLQPLPPAPRLLKQRRAGLAGRHVRGKGSLILGSAARRAHPPTGSPTDRRPGSSECVCARPWLHHLPLITFQQARQFRAAPADTGLYGTFRDAQHLGDFLVVQILQISRMTASRSSTDTATARFALSG